MWETAVPKPVKLICGILAADENCLAAARQAMDQQFGAIDLTSEVWHFTQTDYYHDELGTAALRQFVAFEELIRPDQLAAIKHNTNEMEQSLAAQLDTSLPRPVNLDPGYIEPAKLVLASTKNFAHRIYIGSQMYAEVTLRFAKGAWHASDFTFPDYRQPTYHRFLTRIRDRLIQQRKCT